MIHAAMKRWLPFLILNIIISALTTLLVLNWWDRSHNLDATPQPTPEGAAVLPAVTAMPTATLPGLDQEVIQIDTVIAPGDLANEVVKLVRAGEGDLLLTDWRLEDSSGSQYRFPELVLNPGGSVRLNTRAGSSSVMELFWGLDTAVWESGEVVTLRDRENNVRATYRIP